MKNKSFYISPNILIILNATIVAISVIFPNEIYTKYMKETDYFYLNYLVIFITYIDLLALFIGYKVAYILPYFNLIKSSRKIYLTPSLYIGLPLIFFEILVFLFIKNFLNDNESIIQSMLLSGFGNSYKEHLVTNFYYFSIYMLMGCIFWSLNLYYRISKKFFVIRALLGIGILLIILSASLMLARFLLIPFILGIAVIFLKNKNISFQKIILLFILGMFLFIVASLFRTNNSEDIINIILKQFIGYTIASFNRLALVISGDLTYTYADTGYYIAPFFTHIPILHKIVPNIYGVEYSKIWYMEFVNVKEAGLDPAYIWSTVYGYIFSVLKYFSFIYFILVGFFIGISWKGFLNNRIYGIIIYPWIFSSLILFFASNIMFLPQFIGLIYTVIFLSLWSLTFKMKKSNL